MSNVAVLNTEQLNEIPFGVDAEAPEPIEYTNEQLEELNKDYT